MNAHFGRRMAIVACLVTPGVAWAQSSFTDARDHRPTDPFAISSCSDAASREARNRVPMATDIRVTDADVSPSGDTRSDVSGKGTYRTGGGTAQNFTFRCTYDLRKSAADDVVLFL